MVSVFSQVIVLNGLGQKAYDICFLSIVRSFDHVTLIPTFCSSFNQSHATFEVKLCRDWLKDKWKVGIFVLQFNDDGTVKNQMS